MQTYDIPPRRFTARNGEGVCEVVFGPTPVEWRYCDRCKAWVQIEGVLAFFQADHVGCLKCNKPWPRGAT